MILDLSTCVFTICLHLSRSYKLKYKYTKTWCLAPNDFRAPEAVKDLSYSHSVPQSS